MQMHACHTKGGLYTKPRIPHGIYLDSRWFTWNLPGLQVKMKVSDLAGNPSQTGSGLDLDWTWTGPGIPGRFPANPGLYLELPGLQAPGMYLEWVDSRFSLYFGCLWKIWSVFCK